MNILLLQFDLKIHLDNNQVEILTILDNLFKSEIMDYIRETKTNAKIYIGIVIFVLSIYMLYTIPIPTIVATILIGNEALVIFGVQNRKTIPIYVHIWINYWYSIFSLTIVSGNISECFRAGISYQHICFISMYSCIFLGCVWKAVIALNAVKIIKEELSVVIPLVSKPA